MRETLDIGEEETADRDSKDADGIMWTIAGNQLGNWTRRSGAQWGLRPLREILTALVTAVEAKKRRRETDGGAIGENTEHDHRGTAIRASQTPVNTSEAIAMAPASSITATPLPRQKTQ